ncbi:hypothetical protein CEUSTIGMA_g7053.t1 [Chlamydomonas eustigma]|uniref:ADP,ATP carrier protein n=1 Tax=Chlamydomonas eustigma TaxID=1157962 RepID=A0A250X9S5_9CHLO|nr:hypothetical protein CEUSTIGMA_g7053.t1 [Chlamydomonas eustigma]|eukprot:GAX79612.1 hypothetical protein CEUSTIGMA_g7053.t1 [Chlamydomonas eustigma]
MSYLQLLRYFVSVSDVEVAPVCYSFLTLFCLLASYFVVVPLREEAGIALGTDILPKLFTCTLIGTVVASPLTSAFLSRHGVSKEASLRQFYTIVATTLMGFYLLYYMSNAQAQATIRLFSNAVYELTGEAAGISSQKDGHISPRSPPPPAPPSPADSRGAVYTGNASLDKFQKLVRAAFYIFINVQNLVAISAIWARCTDVFSSEAASRLFGFISAGGTLGQLVGSLVTAAVAKIAAGKKDGGPVHGLIFFSAVLMYCAAFLSSRVLRPGGGKRFTADASSVDSIPTSSKSSQLSPVESSMDWRAGGGRPMLADSSRGGSGSSTGSRASRFLQQVTQSFTLILASPYLLLLCAYLMMTYVVGSLMYFQRSLVVASVVKDSNNRTAFFASVYSLSALVTIMLQMFATGHLLRAVGVTAALACFPVTCAILIASVGVWPSTTVVALGEVIRKLLGYTLVRPAREVLFTVVSREEKYKAKVTIDAVVQRLGDTMAALMFEVLDVQLHLGQAGVAVAGVSACAIWCYCSFKLGSKQRVLASHHAHALSLLSATGSGIGGEASNTSACTAVSAGKTLAAL